MTEQIDMNKVREKVWNSKELKKDILEALNENYVLLPKGETEKDRMAHNIMVRVGWYVGNLIQTLIEQAKENKLPKSLTVDDCLKLYDEEGIIGLVETVRDIAKQEVAREIWISVTDRLPMGQWSVNHPYWSEEVLIANSCSINIGYYDRDNEGWYVAEGTFGVNKERIDKITHWMPLPINPHESRYPGNKGGGK